MYAAANVTHWYIYILSAVKDLEQEEEEVFLQQFKYTEISYGNREIRMMISSVDAKWVRESFTHSSKQLQHSDSLYFGVLCAVWIGFDSIEYIISKYIVDGI